MPDNMIEFASTCIKFKGCPFTLYVYCQFHANCLQISLVPEVIFLIRAEGCGFLFEKKGRQGCYRNFQGSAEQNFSNPSLKYSYIGFQYCSGSCEGYCTIIIINNTSVRLTTSPIHRIWTGQQIGTK